MNNDLISRSELKKAIENLVVGGAEGLKNYYENGSKSDENAWIGGVYDAWELIDNAPTVEPKEVYMTAKDYNLYLEGYKQGKKDFDRPNEWISVSERLPEEGQDVLVCLIYKDTTHFAVTRLLNNKQWLCFSDVEVIAWQPLPEPYKKGGEEE